MAWMPRVTPKVEQLVARAPERTIFTRFIPPEKPEDAPGRWRTYYKKWSHVTRRQLDHRLIDLLAVLTRYAPPAIIFDKAVYSAFGNPQLHRQGADCRAARLWPSRASASLVRTEIIARSFSASAP